MSSKIEPLIKITRVFGWRSCSRCAHSIPFIVGMSTSMTAHVGLGAGGCRERLLSACRLADDLQPWFACEQGLERVQEGCIVVDEQNPDRLGFYRV